MQADYRSAQKAESLLGPKNYLDESIEHPSISVENPKLDNSLSRFVASNNDLLTLILSHSLIAI